MIGNDRKIFIGVGIAIVLAACCLGSLAVTVILFSDQSLAGYGAAASPTEPGSIRRTSTSTAETPFAIYLDATETLSPTLAIPNKATSTRTPIVGLRTPVKSSCPQGCISATSGCVIKGYIYQGRKLYLLPTSTYYDRAVMDPNQGARWFCTEQEAIANGWQKGE